MQGLSLDFPSVLAGQHRAGAGGENSSNHFPRSRAPTQLTVRHGVKLPLQHSLTHPAKLRRGQTLYQAAAVGLHEAVGRDKFEIKIRGATLQPSSLHMGLLWVRQCPLITEGCHQWPFLAPTALSPVPAKQNVQVPAPVTAPRIPLYTTLCPQRGTSIDGSPPAPALRCIFWPQEQCKTNLSIIPVCQSLLCIPWLYPTAGTQGAHSQHSQGPHAVGSPLGTPRAAQEAAELLGKPRFYCWSWFCCSSHGQRPPRSEHVALTPAHCHPHTQILRDSREPTGVGWCPGRTEIPWCTFSIQAQHSTVPYTWSSSVPTSLLQGIPERHLPDYPLLTRHSRPISCQTGHCLDTRAPSPSIGHPKSPQGRPPFHGGAAPFHPRVHNAAHPWGCPSPAGGTLSPPHCYMMVPLPRKAPTPSRETSIPQGTLVPPHSRELPRLIPQPRKVPLVLLPLFQSTSERYPGADPVPLQEPHTCPPAECLPPMLPQQSCLGPTPSTQHPPLSPTLGILERLIQDHPFLLMASQKGSPG